jgi:hypothetical protein
MKTDKNKDYGKHQYRISVISVVVTIIGVIISMLVLLFGDGLIKNKYQLFAYNASSLTFFFAESLEYEEMPTSNILSIVQEQNSSFL